MKVKDLFESSFASAGYPLSRGYAIAMSAQDNEELQQANVFGKWWKLSIGDLKDELLRYKYDSKISGRIRRVIKAKRNRMESKPTGFGETARDLVKRKYRRRFSINEGADNRYYLSLFIGTIEIIRNEDIGRYNSLKTAAQVAFRHYITPLENQLRGDFDSYLQKDINYAKNSKMFVPVPFRNGNNEILWDLGEEGTWYVVKQGSYPTLRDIITPQVYARKIKLRRTKVAKKRREQNVT